MKKLRNTEEQIMQYLRRLKKAFLKDFIGGFTSFFACEQDLSLSELEEMRPLTEKQINNQEG